MKIKTKGTLGNNFMRLVEQAGFDNLFQLQEETGLPYSTSYELAIGRAKSPKLDTLRQLAKIFKMDLGKLLEELTK